jgi:hypothetical protein
MIHQVHPFFARCRCIEDVAKVRVDPTGTERIRRQLYSALAIRWRRVASTIRAGVIDQDLLGSKPLSAMALQSVAPGGATRVQLFQGWIDRILSTMLVDGDVEEIKALVGESYDAGVQHARGDLDSRDHFQLPREDRVNLILSLIRVELQGIAEAVSQQAVRAVANGLMNNTATRKILRQILAAIDSVGQTRTKTMVELMVVKTFSDASLDLFEAAGETEVGVIAESDAAKPKRRRATDADVQDLKRRARTGPGSRIKKGQEPSLRTIQRIKKVERELEKSKWVNVETAEDDLVCAICESIADYGPYKINAARSLIPAHPYCRCVFVKARRPKDRTDD